MSMTDRRTITLVGGAIASMGLLGFALGLSQAQKTSPDQPTIPMPSQGRPMNLEAVPQAAPLDAAAANALVDPSAQKAKARKVDADNAMDDGPDDGPTPLPVAAPPSAPAPTPAPAPANAAPHGPF